ncbi:hypothetical protein Taro_007125 [Colocasia esculenta]|uniref:non-specific serine/threonine protein kinase n=1 Tax=Colocasia esculenta TaxID=4460 RepID=A0A843TYS6_COLES|nr:hypothetical protein [Colocasia esculenta]
MTTGFFFLPAGSLGSHDRAAWEDSVTSPHSRHCCMPLLQVARRGCRYSQFFDVYGNLKYIVELNSCPMAEVLEGSCGFSRRDADAMAKFLLPMLAYDPVQRPKPHHLLHDPWLKASADAGAEEDAFPCPLSEPSETVTNRLLIEKEEGQQRKPIGAGEDGPGEGGGGRRDEPEEEEDVFDVDDIKLVLGSLGRDRRLTEEEGKAVEPEISEAGH